MTDRVVTAAIIIIGNEILSGRTQDTNVNTLATQLGSWGIRVLEVRVIPDVESTIVDTVNALRTQHDYVFTTGGIGPTHDDITAESIAKAFGVPLVISEDIAAIIRQRPAPDDVMASRLLMARIPDGADLIDNPTGGPQGFKIGNVHVMAGIPRVMAAMLSTLEPHLEGGSVVRSASVTTFCGESQIAGALGEIQQRHPEVDLGSYPFSRDGRYGTMLVMRGTDLEQLDVVLIEVQDAVKAAGETPIEIVNHRDETAA